ncbi:hypothetical protein CNR22_12045 [Sphingobacteriaceae bacterium]|nr:hypothetical protein CNR22_12045 [Sphingobacteriaceae bacterium]
MGENQRKLEFEEVLRNNNLEDFISGRENYFVLDKEFDEHWALGSYQKFILPYLKVKGNIFEEIFWQQIIQVMADVNDKNIFMDLLIAYLIPYYHNDDFNITQLRKNNTPQDFINKIREFVSENKLSLQKDLRGSGIELYSSNGLFEGITNNLKVIFKRGGPNFLPNDFI